MVFVHFAQRFVACSHLVHSWNFVSLFAKFRTKKRHTQAILSVAYAVLAQKMPVIKISKPMKIKIAPPITVALLEKC